MRYLPCVALIYRPLSSPVVDTAVLSAAQGFRRFPVTAACATCVEREWGLAVRRWSFWQHRWR